MKNYKKLYRDLETSVFNELRGMIEKSKYLSKHLNQPAIQIDLFDYTEMAVVNDRLTFLDRNGYHYGIFGDATLEDLIDIISKN